MLNIILFVFRFVHVLKSLDMSTPVKVCEKRIYSIAIHPSETSLIVAVGDMNGNLCEAEYIIKIFLLWNSYNN